MAHGHVPNIFAEKGCLIEWKHDKKELILKLAAATAVVAGATVPLSRESDKPSGAS